MTKCVLFAAGGLRSFVSCKAWVRNPQIAAPAMDFIPYDTCLALRLMDQPAAQCPACEQFCLLTFRDEDTVVPSEPWRPNGSLLS